jgi:hypothetical protein
MDTVRTCASRSAAIDVLPLSWSKGGLIHVGLPNIFCDALREEFP